MCGSETADGAPVPEAALRALPGPLLVLGQHVRVVQSGFGSHAAWLDLLRVLGERGARVGEDCRRLGDACCRLLEGAPRLLLPRTRLAWA